jgi:hypothetical protein
VLSLQLEQALKQNNVWRSYPNYPCEQRRVEDPRGIKFVRNIGVIGAEDNRANGGRLAHGNLIYYQKDPDN